MPAAEAFALALRFEFHLTPKPGSWLKMIEIEFSAWAKQCLDRRISTQEKLNAEIQALVTERQQPGIQSNRQFSIESARSQFSRHDHGIYTGNPECPKT